jgi:hypothetical protein
MLFSSGYYLGAREEALEYQELELSIRHPHPLRQPIPSVTDAGFSAMP